LEPLLRSLPLGCCLAVLKVSDPFFVRLTVIAGFASHVDPSDFVNKVQDAADHWTPRPLGVIRSPQFVGSWFKRQLFHWLFRVKTKLSVVLDWAQVTNRKGQFAYICSVNPTPTSSANPATSDSPSVLPAVPSVTNPDLDSTLLAVPPPVTSSDSEVKTPNSSTDIVMAGSQEARAVYMDPDTIRELGQIFGVVEPIKAALCSDRDGVPRGCGGGCSEVIVELVPPDQRPHKSRHTPYFKCVKCKKFSPG